MRRGGTALHPMAPRTAAAPQAPVRPARTVPRRGPAHGPRPVRPRVVATAARPVQPPRPRRAGERWADELWVGEPGRRGERVLLRAVPVLPPEVLRRRRVVATIGMALLSAAVVVLLELLADVAAAARHTDRPAEVTSTSPTAVVPPSLQVTGAIGG